MVWLKSGNFSILNSYFRQNRPGKFVYDILERKNGLTPRKNPVFGTLKNEHFYRKGHLFFLSRTAFCTYSGFISRKK